MSLICSSFRGLKAERRSVGEETGWETSESHVEQERVRIRRLLNVL